MRAYFLYQKNFEDLNKNPAGISSAGFYLFNIKNNLFGLLF